MRTLTAAVLTSLLLVSGACLYVSVHGRNVVTDGPVAIALAAVLDDPTSRTVDYKALGEKAEVPFTEMLVFEPFTPRDEICRAVDLTGFDCVAQVPYQVASDFYFVVFRQQTTVVHREYQALSHGRFAALRNGFRLADSASEFKVVRNFSSRDSNGYPQTYLTPKRQSLFSDTPSD